MGKNRIVKSLGKILGNMAVHKALVEHTNREESKGFLSKEIIEYRENALKKMFLFNWNESDKTRIREEALKYAKNIKDKKYSDTKISSKEIENEIDIIIADIGI